MNFPKLSTFFPSCAQGRGLGRAAWQLFHLSPRDHGFEENVHRNQRADYVYLSAWPVGFGGGNEFSSCCAYIRKYSYLGCFLYLCVGYFTWLLQCKLIGVAQVFGQGIFAFRLSMCYLALLGAAGLLVQWLLCRWFRYPVVLLIFLFRKRLFRFSEHHSPLAPNWADQEAYLFHRDARHRSNVMHLSIINISSSLCNISAFPRLLTGGALKWFWWTVTKAFKPGAYSMRLKNEVSLLVFFPRGVEHSEYKDVWMLSTYESRSLCI